MMLLQHMDMHNDYMHIGLQNIVCQTVLILRMDCWLLDKIFSDSSRIFCYSSQQFREKVA